MSPVFFCTPWFSDVFKGFEKKPVAWNNVTSSLLIAYKMSCAVYSNWMGYFRFKMMKVSLLSFFFFHDLFMNLLFSLYFEWSNYYMHKNSSKHASKSVILSKNCYVKLEIWNRFMFYKVYSQNASKCPIGMLFREQDKIGRDVCGHVSW